MAREIGFHDLPLAQQIDWYVKTDYQPTIPIDPNFIDPRMMFTTCLPAMGSGGGVQGNDRAAGTDPDCCTALDAQSLANDFGIRGVGYDAAYPWGSLGANGQPGGCATSCSSVATAAGGGYGAGYGAENSSFKPYPWGGVVPRSPQTTVSLVDRARSEYEQGWPYTSGAAMIGMTTRNIGRGYQNLHGGR